MIELNIPDFGVMKLKTLVLDFNGTCAINGSLIAGVDNRLETLAEKLELVVVTADTFGTVHETMKSLPVRVQVLEKGINEAVAKQQMIHGLRERHVVAIGNGRNDVLMLDTAALGIAVIQEEGAACVILKHADIVVRDICHALDLLIHQDRLLATLRS